MKLAVKRQLTVSLENQPGRLAELSAVIADHGFNIEALCVVDNNEQSVARLIVDTAERCKNALSEASFDVVESEVLAIPLPDQRGRLAEVTKALAAAHINIDYAYATVDHDDRAHRSQIVMKVSNIRLAEEVIRALMDR